MLLMRVIIYSDLKYYYIRVLYYIWVSVLELSYRHFVVQLFIIVSFVGTHGSLQHEIKVNPRINTVKLKKNEMICSCKNYNK